MQIKVDCSDESDVRQALDFLARVLEEFPESKKEEFGMLTREETVAKFPASLEPEDPPAFEAPPLPGKPESAEDLDAAGVVWDATKHSSGRTKTANGCWRARARRSKTALDEKEKGYAELLALVSKCVAEEKIALADIKEVCAAMRVEKLTDLADNPEKIKEAYNLVNTRFALQAIGGGIEAVTE